MGNSLFSSKKDELIIQNMSWPLDQTRDAFMKSLFIDIPNEIILHMFRFLSPRDLRNVSLVCRSFKMIADQDELWKSKCNASLKPHSKSYKQIYMEWIHEKSIRNQKLKQLRTIYRFRTACRQMAPPSYPVRPENKHQLKSTSGFNQHPNSTQELTIELSVDIDETASELISLLEKASQFQEQWKEPIVLKQMIQRYYQFMQLKASNPPNILLIPTLDIEIIWQTHFLRPEMYRNDCLRLFRRIIDHSLILKNDIEQFCKEQAFLDTCQLYEQRFGEKYCELPSIEEKNKTTTNHQKSIYSYWDETNFKFSSNVPNDYENPFSFTESDIILDGEWLDLCKDFMSKAIDKLPTPVNRFYRSNEIDLTPGAIKKLKKSYERFLYMAVKYPLKDGNGFIPPTYAIDIIWHSHMQEPLNYEADCLRLVGYIIYHDPWPIVEDENMKKSCDVVDQIWRDEFQCEINMDHLYNTSDNKNPWFD